MPNSPSCRATTPVAPHQPHGATETTAETLTVVLIDDSEDIRALVRMALERSGKFDIVGEAGDGVAGLEAVATHHPDLALLDITMPVMDGIEALPAIKRTAPTTAVVMLSSYPSTGPHARAAMQMGAAAYIDKGAKIRDLPQQLSRIVAATRD